MLSETQTFMLEETPTSAAYPSYTTVPRYIQCSGQTSDCEHTETIGSSNLADMQMGLRQVSTGEIEEKYP